MIGEHTVGQMIGQNIWKLYIFTCKNLFWKIDFIKAVISEFVKGRIGCICRQMIEYKTQ